MKTQVNPFVRGYRNFAIHRVLVITYDDDHPSCYRPLHATQVHLRDDELEMLPCIYCDHFALVPIGQPVSTALHAQCPGSGMVRDILYQITADDFGTPVHVGDVYSADDAREVVRRLTFETGHFSRCWEISARHLPRKAMRYLDALASGGAPSLLLFDAFRVPPSRAIGCKLVCTPWITDVLQEIEGTSAQQLRHQQLRAGVPDSLVRVLHLAAVADTRILIFDPDASMLSGLLIDDDWIHPRQATDAQTPHSAAHQQPVRQLECPVCAGATLGRQWWSREVGYGICTRCAEWLRQRGTPLAEMTQNYGHDGVHYNCMAPAADA